MEQHLEKIQRQSFNDLLKIYYGHYNKNKIGKKSYFQKSFKGMGFIIIQRHAFYTHINMDHYRYLYLRLKFVIYPLISKFKTKQNKYQIIHKFKLTFKLRKSTKFLHAITIYKYLH